METIFSASILKTNPWGKHANLTAESDGRVARWSIFNGSTRVFESLFCTPAEALRQCEARTS